MIKVICDFCGREIECESDHAKLTLTGGLRTVERDFHVLCSVRVKNKLDFFCDNGGKENDCK